MKLNIKILLLSVAAVLWSVASMGQYRYETVEGDPINARIYTLDNGLKVYMAVNKETPRIQTYIAVKVGAKNDPAETTGLAHYFEHLMFKGTEKFGTQDYEAEKPLLDEIERQFEIYRNTDDEQQRAAIYRTIDSLSYAASTIAIPNEYDKLMSAIGATGTNAYTGYDMTVYIEDIPSNQVENWAMIQADRFRNPVIRGFHTELETVYEEKNMYLTNDGMKVMEAMLSSLYPVHPYGTQTVLGTQEHLKNPSITNIKAYHRTWYVPNNMAICLSGDFDPDEMIATIDRYFGDMVPNYDLPEVQTLGELQPITSPIEKEIWGNDAENIVLAWRAGGYRDPDADILNILTSVLYNGNAGLIDLDLLQQQKVLGAYGYYSPLADHGVVIMAGYPKAGQTLDEVRTLLLEEVSKLRNGQFDEQLLEATINNYKAYFMELTDSNSKRADWFVETFVNGLEWEHEVHQLDRMSRITKEEIVEAANRLLQDDNYLVIYKREGRDPGEMKISAPEITPIAVNRDSESDFLRSIRLKEVEPIEPVFVDYDRDMGRFTGKSGIEVLYKQNPTNDLFELSYVYETGSNNDPAMNIAFGYLDYLGTGSLSPEDIGREFYNMACSFSVSSGAERSQITLRGLGENMERAAELLESILADARPNAEALENMKADILKARADAKLNQSANFSALANYALYGPESPLTNILSEQELEAITPEDLLSRIRSLTRMEHRITYYGPLQSDELLAAIERFHHVPAELEPVPELVRYKYQPTDENKVLVVNYDAAQVYYAQISNTEEYYSPALEPQLRLFNEYFGGSMNSIVFQEMREARGLAYMARAYLYPPVRLTLPYYVQAVIATQNDKLTDAVEAFHDILNDMPQSEAALSLAKDAIITTIRTDRIIKASVLGSYIRNRDLGLDYDRNKPVFEKIPSLTLDDIREFHSRWIKDRNYTYILLGDVEDLDLEAMESYGPVTILSQEEIFGY